MLISSENNISLVNPTIKISNTIIPISFNQFILKISPPFVGLLYHLNKKQPPKKQVDLLWAVFKGF